jgi:hypothetical protein
LSKQLVDPDFRESYLVQRLNRIYRPMEEPKEAWKLEADKFPDSALESRQKIYDYDYMGAAEFEFGEIPRVLKALLKDASKLVTYQLSLPVFWEPFGKTPNPPEQPKPIYLLCRKEVLEKVIERVAHLLKTPYHKLYTKESLRVDEAFCNRDKDRGPRGVGWLELNNGFYFFADKTVWRYTTKLFTGKLPE